MDSMTVRDSELILVALHGAAKTAVISPMNATKSREVIWGDRVRAAKAGAEHAHKRAFEAAREADRAEALAWSVRMEGNGGPAQPSPTIAQCLNGGYGWLEVRCHQAGSMRSTWCPIPSPSSTSSS